MKPETLAIHAGNLTKTSTHDVTTPIHLSTTFLRDEDGGYSGGHMYSRVSNPNRSALEKTLTELEKGFEACAFSSGNTAGMALFQALKPGSHIIAPDDMYWGFKKQLQTIFADTLWDPQYCRCNVGIALLVLRELVEEDERLHAGGMCCMGGTRRGRRGLLRRLCTR